MSSNCICDVSDSFDRVVTNGKITKPFRKIMKQKSMGKERQKAMENEMQIERQQIFESEFPFANVNNFSFLDRKRSTGKRSVKLRNTKKLNSNV